jgi:ribonuclease HII
MLLIRHTNDAVVECGLDEAGRGSFWGPLMAGAVIWPRDADDKITSQIRDSKRISPKKRERIADEIKKVATAWGVGSVSATEIDENGIQWANQEAFRRALAALMPVEAAGGAGTSTAVVPGRLLIDGVIGIGEDPVEGREAHNIVDGDALYVPIAAASILAKVEHDRWVCGYCTDNPDCAEKYNLLSCKGYGTAKHREGLGVHGAHALHRRTFVKKYVGKKSQLTDTCKIKLQKN